MKNSTTMFIRDAWKSSSEVNRLWTKDARTAVHEDAIAEFSERGVEYIQTHALELGAAGLGSEAALAASYSAMLFAFDKGETLQFDAWRKSCEHIQALVLRGSTMSLDAAMVTSFMDGKSVHEVRRQIQALYDVRPARTVHVPTANDHLAKVNKVVMGLDLDQLAANTAMSLVQLDALINTLATVKTALSPTTANTTVLV